MAHFDKNSTTLSDKLDSFFHSYDETLDGEWNSGLHDEDWQLLSDIKEILNKSIEKSKDG